MVVGGVRYRWVAASLLTMAACAKGQIGAGSNTSFGVGMSTSSSSTSGNDSADDRSDESESESDEESDSDSNSGPSSGASSGAETCGVGCSEQCGNGAIDDGEDCDGTELGGMDCVGLGLAGGTLACSGCTFDTTMCADAICGDGVIGGAEECDCAGGACTPAGLQDQACTDMPAPSGGNFSGGALACDATCLIDESGCWACGDGTINEGEACDGAALNGATCSGLGFDDGTVACNTSCAVDTSGCVDWVCGNGSCEPNEDSCSCAGDCPDDPNSCSPCQCGGDGGNCWCDAACVSLGDCCANGPC